MTLVPKSLLSRIALVIIFALVASQVVSISLFRYYAREPRVQLLAIGFVGQLKTIRAALEAIPVIQHKEFLQRLREERGIRVFHVPGEEPLEIAPDIPAIRVARERMREEFGSDAEIYARARPEKADAPPLLVTKLPVNNTSYYVVFPRGRIVEQDYTWAWLGWGVFGGILSLAGAMFIMWRVTRPLKALVGAAHELGQGKMPATVAEIGPSEVKSVAVAFNQMRDDLHRLDQERATFLAGVSHDLRTPLSRLRLGIEMLPADKETRADIEQDIADINGVIDQFMDFARDESHEAIEPTDINMMVHSITERINRTNVMVDPPQNAPLKLPLRPLAMRRLITNLIDNAIKHTGTMVTVETAITEDGKQATLKVLDRGEGILPEDVARLKQPFTRLDHSRTGASGAGLGLAIVDRIARLHGGSFDLLPREGGGTEARVTIPVA